MAKIGIRESCRESAQHRLQAYEALSSEVGAKLFNKLPLDLRVQNRIPLLSRLLKRLLVQGAYYSVGEFENHEN
ncbi:hypothetical protein J6590_071973 [Homalodisca vitripennis]|nr:hypothetical protein J6590_071973 [Homalodisca vitripennis]